MLLLRLKCRTALLSLMTKLNHFTRLRLLSPFTICHLSIYSCIIFAFDLCPRVFVYIVTRFFYGVDRQYPPSPSIFNPFIGQPNSILVLILRSYLWQRRLTIWNYPLMTACPTGEFRDQVYKSISATLGVCYR